MPRIISKLLLAVLLPPAATIVFISLIVARDRFGAYRDLWGIATTLSSAFAFAYWFGLWASLVTWNARRVQLTIGAIALSIFIGCCAAYVIAGSRGDSEMRPLLTGMISTLLGLISTAVVWRETSHERLTRLRADSTDLHCPNCDYNLNGLHEARCPECGTQYTLKELFASQSKRGTDVEL